MPISDNDVIERGDLDQLSFIDEGGQGKVYDVHGVNLPDCPGALVYKEYKPGQVTAAGLEAIVSMRSRLSPEERKRLDELAAWPVRLVKEKGQMTGILMPRIPERFFNDGVSARSGQRMHKIREIQYLFIAPGRCTSVGFPLVNLFQRYAICREMASALAFLADHKVVFGDVNAKNALFNVGPPKSHHGEIMLVDCDAVRVSGTASAVKQLNSPDWFPPKPERAFLTHSTDVYKFALFVIRCLSPGPGASAASNPKRVEKVLDAEGLGLVRASLDEDKKKRPQAKDWAAYFTALTEAGPKRTQTAALKKPATDTGPPRAATPESKAKTGWVKNEQGMWVRAD